MASGHDTKRTFGRHVRLAAVAAGLLFLLAWELYPLRELLVAELLFAIFFLLMAAFGAALYFLGAATERAADLARAQAPIAARSIAHVYLELERLARRFIHQPAAHMAK